MIATLILHTVNISSYDLHISNDKQRQFAVDEPLKNV